MLLCVAMCMHVHAVQVGSTHAPHLACDGRGRNCALRCKRPAVMLGLAAAPCCDTWALLQLHHLLRQVHRGLGRLGKRIQGEAHHLPQQVVAGAEVHRDLCCALLHRHRTCLSPSPGCSGGRGQRLGSCKVHLVHAADGCCRGVIAHRARVPACSNDGQEGRVGA